jgi:hypothetical protein
MESRFRVGTSGSFRFLTDEIPAVAGLLVTVQSLVFGSGERGEGVAAVVGGDEFAQVRE